MASADELAAQLAELTASLKEAQEFFEPLKNEAAELRNAKRLLDEEYRKQTAEINNKLSTAQAKLSQAGDSVWSLQAKAQSIENQIKAAKAAEEEAAKQAAIAAKQAEQNAALTERFDKLTLTAHWREWAKDHQLEAGKMMVQNRYVIEADPMGLGKTLSSIVTVEMAERATKDTSKEFPFLGEEKEVVTADYWIHKVSGQRYNWKTSDIVQNPDNYVFHEGKTETKIVNAIERPVGRRVLYLCPSSLLRNVRDEWKMWAPHRNVTFIGGMSKAERNFFLDTVMPNVDNYVIVCNYEAWRKDLALIDTLAAVKFDTVIIDEAHNAKSRKTSVWRGIAELIGIGNKHTHRPEYVIPMTGTPVLNRPQELFTLLNMVRPDRFYHENDFLYSYCTQDDAGFWQFKPGGMDRLSKQLSDCFIRRSRDQAGIKLPPKTIIHHDLDVDVAQYPDQSRAREQMRKFATIKLNEKDEFGQPKALSANVVIAMYTRLRQIETWPAGIIQRDPKTKNVILQVDVEESQKVDYVISPDGKEGLIPDAIEDERIVLFSQFKAPLREIAKRIESAGYSVAILDGEASDDYRDEVRKDFDAKSASKTDFKYNVVLCNYRVGGVGLNLTSASQMIILDEEWNPGKRDQAYDRLHRMGQENPVTIHVIRMNKTIDDWLASIMEAKDNLVNGFNNGISGKDFKDALESGLI